MYTKTKTGNNSDNDVCIVFIRLEIISLAQQNTWSNKDYFLPEWNHVGSQRKIMLFIKLLRTVAHNKIIFTHKWRIPVD